VVLIAYAGREKDNGLFHRHYITIVILWGMRYPPTHKQQSSERILRAAARLFRRHGYSATGVDAVMASAELTAGAFYAHFRSKENLLAQALDTAFRQSRQDWPEGIKDSRGRRWVREFASFYLSSGHRDGLDHGCPMPALAPEIGRIGGKSRAVFEQHLRELLKIIRMKIGPTLSDRRAISAVAQCVGGLMLSRAVGDPAFSDEILCACRAAVVEESTCAEEDHSVRR
jgi:TetR/AcrR family transcriptional repressor of nem operon